MLQQLKELISINRMIVSSLDYDEILRIVVEKTAELTGADVCMLLLAGAGNEASVAATVGVSPEKAAKFVAPLDERIHDALRTFLDYQNEDTFLGSPLIDHGDIRGILVVYRRGQHPDAGNGPLGSPGDLPSDPDEEFLLSALADQAAIALSHALRYRKERKVAEDALRRSEAELRRRVKELAEADRRKDEFLSMLGHELRNPLAPVLTVVQTMRLRGSGDPVLQRAERVIERQVQHMARLLDDLLDVSRITRGKIELRKQPLDLALAVNEAVQIIGPEIDARGHKLQVALAPEPLWIEADPDRFAQILTNLLSNAVKYTEPGGQIWVSVARDGKDAVVSIRDTGMGMPPDLLPHVFDLFIQGERSADRSEGGLGIGLTLVQRLMELHGGSIRARSEGRGRGSEFVARLPAAATPPVEAQDTGQDPAKHEGALRVLVVDDNIDVAEVLSELVKIAGHHADIAYTGPCAIEAARKNRPDVMLLDIGLPGMDGCEVARRVRDELGDMGPVMVALTGYGGEADVLRTKQAGFHHHLVKPAEWTELERILAGVSPRAR